MRNTTLAAFGALLLIGATAAVLMTAAGQDSQTTTGSSTDPTNTTPVSCPALPGNATALRLAFLVGKDPSSLPPWISVNWSGYADYLNASGLNASTLAACLPHPHAHGFGFGPWGPRHARCQQNQTA